MASGVVSRLKAEQDASFWRGARRVLDDTRVVWAATGATAASVVCAFIVQGILLLASQERPDSLSALLTTLASSGTNQNPSTVGGGVRLPRAYSDAVMAAAIAYQGSSDEAAVTLAAVVTREGTVSNVELLALDEGRRPSEDAGELLSVLDQASLARFEPARHAGNPVAVNMVWLLARTTVRGDSRRLRSAAAWPKPALSVPLPPTSSQPLPEDAPSAQPPERPNRSARTITHAVGGNAQRLRSGVTSPRAVATLFIASIARRMTPLAARSASIINSNCSVRESEIPSFG